MPGLPDRPDLDQQLDRWSFGGAAAIEIPSGLLLPEALIAGADYAVLSTSLTPTENDARPDPEGPAELTRTIDEEIRALEASVQIGDITVVDDRGATYALRVLSMSGAHGPSPASTRFLVDPVPARGIAWLQLRGQNGMATRLLRSTRATTRLGPLTRLAVSPLPADQRPDDRLPAGRGALADRAELTDGPRHRLDLGLTLPPIDGMTLRIDSLISAPGSWSMFLRAEPRWWRYRDDRRRKWSPVTISAEDDRGCSYQHTFGGSAGRDGCEEVTLQFGPRLDPLARVLRLTCTGPAEQITVELDLTD